MQQRRLLMARLVRAGLIMTVGGPLQAWITSRLLFSLQPLSHSMSSNRTF
jgi:hypothetical protein